MKAKSMSVTQGVKRRAGLSLSVAASLAALVLFGAGWGHRALLARINQALGTMVRPAQPLASLPLELGAWRGRDVPLDRRVEGAANFDDDFLNRVYLRRADGAQVAAFIGYVGRPRAQLGHRPDVCYAAHGWDEVGQERVEIPLAGGETIPGIVYEFRRPNRTGWPMRVLATYVINGRYVKDPDEFARWNTRNPGLLGERPAYLARIQLVLQGTSDAEADLRLLGEFMPLIARPTLALMPYWES